MGLFLICIINPSIFIPFVFSIEKYVSDQKEYLSEICDLATSEDLETRTLVTDYLKKVATDSKELFKKLEDEEKKGDDNDDGESD